MEIIPSILVQSSEEFLSQITAIDGILPQVQLDIADGILVPNKTWADPKIVRTVPAHIAIELHLMVEHPRKELERWINIPQIKKVLFHRESKDATQKTIDDIHFFGWEAGLVFNPETPIIEIENFEMFLESVMLMGVHPGFQGQSFLPETLEKIKKLKRMYPHLCIEVDGGVNLETIPGILSAGADGICPGSATWEGPQTPKENIEKMQSLMHRLTEGG